MNVAAERTERFLIISLAIGFIVQQLTHLAWMPWVLGVIVFTTIIVLLPKIRGITMILSAAFLVTGIGILWVQRAPVQTWLDAAAVNITLVTLFVFAPLFGIPVRSPRFVEALKWLYRTRVKGKGSFFIASQLLTQILAVFLNVGSISVVYHLASIHPSSRSWRILGNALNRGFAAAIYWSPYFAAMALVTSALKLAWIDLLPYVLGFSLLSFVLSFLVELPFLMDRGDASREVAAGSEAEEGAADEAAKGESVLRSRLWQLALYLILAIIIVLSMEQLLPLPIVIITVFAAVLYPLIWCLLSRSFDAYKQGATDHFVRALPSLKKEITLFLTAGFFSGAIAQTGLGAAIPALLAAVPLPLPIVFTISAMLLVFGTSLIGSHPIIVVTILATTVDPASVGISPLFFGVLLLGSWGISNTISPAAAVNNLISSLLKRDVLELAFKNYKFAALLLILLPIYLFLVNV
ncbi:hypothetical protein [Paenibacillus abyssi]|uniref:Uncharacterized protein n=1 Tax=Paenibacillus abyssi TaxID=1340531 RepID=A0A917FMT8_9BACL|nr:hypothetical protein [Paenibacillus abyssi]GGF94525.1 hypothetical protein GCM10010916_09840 [Paenibacillus abyssi]